MNIVEVRCCCDAGKLMGTVEVEDMGASHARFVVGESVVTLEWGIFYKPATFTPTSTDRGFYCAALKSMDLPIETLRRIPTFKEAK